MLFASRNSYGIKVLNLFLFCTNFTLHMYVSFCHTTHLSLERVCRHIAPIWINKLDVFVSFSLRYNNTSYVLAVSHVIYVGKQRKHLPFQVIFWFVVIYLKINSLVKIIAKLIIGDVLFCLLLFPCIEIGHSLRFERNGKVNADENWWIECEHHAGETDPEALHSTGDNVYVVSKANFVIRSSHYTIESRQFTTFATSQTWRHHAKVLEIRSTIAFVGKILENYKNSWRFQTRHRSTTSRFIGI